MLALYLEGKSFKAIAKEVGRHWQTARKYVTRALQEREGEELRREALKEALVDHFQDLVHALGSLTELLPLPGGIWRESPDGWRPTAPERRNRLLLQALRDSHASESPLWSWWESWNQVREAYDRALLDLQKRVMGELVKLEKLYPKASLTLAEDLTEVLLNRGASMATGSALYDPSMLRISPPADQEGNIDRGELWLAHSIRLAAGRDMPRLRERLHKLMEDMGKWEEIQTLERLYRQMAETKDKIDEEIEVLTLRRAFPGHCRLCPI
jgi:hypothetical protein